MRFLMSTHKRQVQSINIAKATNVGLYIHCSSVDCIKGALMFRKELKDKGLLVHTVVYLPKTSKNQPEVITEDELNRLEICPNVFVIRESDLGFNHLPNSSKKAELKAFLKQTFDIYFDTSEHYHYVDSYISMSSAAFFKIGFKKDDLDQEAGSGSGLCVGVGSPYDLSLKGEESNTYLQNLSLLLYYMENF